MAKMLKPSHNSTVKPEEWIYYYPHKNTKESYLFKNGHLVGYKTAKAV
jgi:hypothetical protein